MPSQNLISTFEDLGAALDQETDLVLNLPLAQVYEDPANPRQRFDEAEIEALAATLKRHGLLQPIVVWPADDRGRFRIRLGARRYRAAARAGLEEIRAIVRAGDGSEAETLIEQLIENDQREGLSTAELARAVDRLLEAGLTQAAIAERLGRPRPQISMLAQIKAMPKELQALAPTLGVRTLHELNTAWKADAGRTRAWLKRREPRSITQAEARDLAGRQGAERRLVRDPSDGSVREEAPERDARPRAASSSGAIASASSGAARATAIFDVQARKLAGTLVLDDVRAPSAGVRVRLADGRVVSVPAAHITIVGVRPG